MLRRAVGLTAASAFGASALLLPPGISAGDGTLSLASVLDPKHHSIRLPCPTCAFSSEKDNALGEARPDDLLWGQGEANDITLNFSISDDGRELQINGITFFPREYPNLPNGDLYVNQVAASASADEVSSGEAKVAPLQVTGVAWGASDESPASDGGDVIVPFHFDIIDLERQHMQIDGLKVQLLKTTDGELLIMKVDRVPNPVAHGLGMPPHHPHPGMYHPPHGPPPSVDGMKECETLPEFLCKFKNMMEAKLSGLRHGPHPPPCASAGPHGEHGSDEHPHHFSGFLPTHIKPHLDFVGPPPERPYHHGPPHHMRPHDEMHHGPYHHHHHHRVLHTIVHGLVAVLIPVVAGITVGLAVSLMGLMLGRLMGFVWTTVRCRNGGYEIVTSEEKDEAELCGEGLDAPPPVYEQAPAYEETEKEASVN